MSTVLVTGGSGFIGSHCIVQLLAAGHTVRTTVRSLEREPAVRAAIASAVEADDRLTCVAPTCGVTNAIVRNGLP